MRLVIRFDMRAPQFATPADQCLELATSLGPQTKLVFHPLIGGTPPEIAWRGLRAFADDVLPSLRQLGYV